MARSMTKEWTNGTEVGRKVKGWVIGFVRLETGEDDRWRGRRRVGRLQGQWRGAWLELERLKTKEDA